jgi:hypothetical protein
MHAKSPLKKSGVDLKSSRPASGWITGATAARIERFIRLSLRHDATVRRPGKAAIASENWARDIEVICPGTEAVAPASAMRTKQTT